LEVSPSKIAGIFLHFAFAPPAWDDDFGFPFQFCSFRPVSLGMDEISELLRGDVANLPGKSLPCRGRVRLNRAPAVSRDNGNISETARVKETAGSTTDPEQFLRLFMESERRIYAFIVSVLPNLTDADDILQETSLILWKKFDQFRPGTDFVAWACRTAQFEVLKFYEKQGRSRLQFDAEGLEVLQKEVVTMGPLIEAQHTALARCLEQLTPRDRDLLKRRYVDDAAPKLIAQQVGRSLDAVYKALTRIRDGLLNCIQQKLKKESGL
jgi:RNA polymerase sigma-70 factor, ECF subfamily